MKFISTVLLITLLLNCTPEKKPIPPIVTLKNDLIEIRIIPAVGGSLVYASLAGQANILNSDSSLWNESPDKRPSLDPRAPFKTYNGHTTWLSPQSEWWARQDSFPDLKKKHSLWPPDPILTIAPYQITRQSHNEITLVSPESPYSKVQFTKTYRIEGNVLYLSTEALNVSNDTISWGLWQNTRMNGWDAVFVRADSAALLRTDFMQHGSIRKPELHFMDGFFSYEAVSPVAGQPAYHSKSFIATGKPLVAGYHENQWLIIRSDTIDPSLIHPEQARIEIYVENSVHPEKDLQELELHFAYRKIAPRAAIEASETWEILPGSGLTDKKALLEELKDQLK